MKKLVSVALVLIICVSLSLPVFASDSDKIALKEIVEASREYHSLSGFEVWENDWDEGVGTEKATSIGDVKSKYGTHSFTHRVYVD